MKHALHAPAALLLALFLAALFPYVGWAADVRAGEQPSISANERVVEDAYIAGGNVSSAGVVVGDLVAAGGNVLVSGGVGGDVAAAGGSLTILGNVADDLRAAGGNILIQGAIGGDAALAGGQLTIGGAGIEGDLLAGGGVLRLDASVGGNVRVAGGDVYLNSAIAGNVVVYAEKLTLGKDARIQGDLTYSSEREASFEEGAVVSGETTFKQVEKNISSVGPAVGAFGMFGTFLSQLMGALLLGLIFKRYALTLVENAASKPLIEFGRGLIVAIVLPIVSVMLFVTLIGIPLGVLGLLAFVAGMLCVWFSSAVVLGSIVHRQFSKAQEHDVSWKTILLGTALYSLLGVVPFVGPLAQFVLIVLTLGAAAKLKWDIAKEYR